jgi:hypothetical protein
MLHLALDLRDRIPRIGALLIDGRIILKAGSRIHLPDWNTTTPIPDTPPPAVHQARDRDLHMPLRKRTRDERRRNAVTAERERNRRLDAQHPAPF